MLVLVTWYINRKMFNSKLRLKKKTHTHTELQPPTTPSSSTVWYWEVVGALASQASNLGSISHFFSTFLFQPEFRIKRLSIYVPGYLEPSKNARLHHVKPFWKCSTPNEQYKMGLYLQNGSELEHSWRDDRSSRFDTQPDLLCWADSGSWCHMKMGTRVPIFKIF